MFEANAFGSFFVGVCGATCPAVDHGGKPVPPCFASHSEVLDHRTVSALPSQLEKRQPDSNKPRTTYRPAEHHCQRSSGNDNVGVSECLADLRDVLEARIGRSARDPDVPAALGFGDISPKRLWRTWKLDQTPTRQQTKKTRPDRSQSGFFKRGAKGIRTPDPHTASVVRYQLRHSPVCRAPRSYTTATPGSKSLVRGPLHRPPDRARGPECARRRAVRGSPERRSSRRRRPAGSRR